LSREGGEKMSEIKKKSHGRRYTPWGVEVKKCLLEGEIEQNSVVERLNELGYSVTKKSFSDLLFGVGASTEANQNAMKAVNAMLGISAV
jgi:hypothetical protein